MSRKKKEKNKENEIESAKADGNLLRGKAHRYGDNVDTDVIIPARYCMSIDEAELGSHCLEDLDPEFVRKLRPGDMIVAGGNFGCGSSREVAPVAIKAAGVSAVVAKSFARIFFRNALNIGLPVFECPEAADAVRDGDEMEIAPSTGEIRAGGKAFSSRGLPDLMREIVACGGMVEYVRRRLKASSG